MTLPYSSKRPDEAYDSLQALEDEYTDPTHEPEYAFVVGKIERHAIKKEKGGFWKAQVGFAQVEIVTGEVAEAAQKMLTDAYSARTGKNELDLDFTPDEPEASVTPIKKTR